MTTSTPSLPLIPNWKALYDQTEAFWTKPLQQVLGSDSYLAMAGAIREQGLTRHQLTKEAAEAYWEALRLPTKSDHARLAGQIVALEGKLEAASERLDDLHTKLDAILAAVTDTARGDDGARSASVPGNPKKKQHAEA